MSEYQFVHFMAIDRPLDDKQLRFMRKQSTRAEITPWEFTNQYDYGDFRGDTLEMLRHGFDVHLHYANFGIRRLMIRLPAGLPCDRRTFEAYEAEGLAWIADKRGSGGVLEVYPEADAGTYEEDLFDVDSLLPKIAPVREQLMSGDLRALYLAWLACAWDEEALEPPVPAGLDKPTSALVAITGLYELSDDLIAAAAELSPSTARAIDADRERKAWIAEQSQDTLRELAEQLLGGDAAAARAEALSRMRDGWGRLPGRWPSRHELWHN
jgi:hypothetical protein